MKLRKIPEYWFEMPDIKIDGKEYEVMAYSGDNGETYTQIKIVADNKDIYHLNFNHMALIINPAGSYKIISFSFEGNSFTLEVPRIDIPKYLNLETTINDYLNKNFEIVEDGE